MFVLKSSWNLVEKDLENSWFSKQTLIWRWGHLCWYRKWVKVDLIVLFFLCVFDFIRVVMSNSPIFRVQVMRFSVLRCRVQGYRTRTSTRYPHFYTHCLFTRHGRHISFLQSAYPSKLEKKWPAFSFKMRYDLRESDETSGLHAWLKSTKFVFLSPILVRRPSRYSLGRVTYFEAFFFAPPRPSPLPIKSWTNFVPRVTMRRQRNHYHFKWIQSKLGEKEKFVVAIVYVLKKNFQIGNFMS